MGRSRRRPTARRRTYADSAGPRRRWSSARVSSGGPGACGRGLLRQHRSGSTDTVGRSSTLAHVIATSPDGVDDLRRRHRVPAAFRLTTSSTTAYDARTGVQRWIDRYDGPAGAEDYVDSLVVNPAGSRVFVSGTSFGSGSDDIATIAYRVSTGERIWVRRLGPAEVQDFARGLTVSPDGARVFITATTERAASRSDIVTAGIPDIDGAEAVVGARRGVPAAAAISAQSLGGRAPTGRPSSRPR